MIFTLQKFIIRFPTCFAWIRLTNLSCSSWVTHIFWRQCQTLNFRASCRMVTSISSFNWPLFTWRLFTVPKKYIYMCIYIFFILVSEIVFSWAVWSCFILIHMRVFSMPPAFSGWFSQGFVDFCSCSCLYSCLLSCEVLTFFFGVVQLNFPTFQGSLLCFSLQIVLCSNASWRTLKMLPCLMPPSSKCQCAKGCSWMVLSE